MKKYISYCRVSSKQQIKTGNSLSSQEDLIKDYVFTNGGKIIKNFCEIRSGNKSFQIELFNAIEFAKTSNAVIVVSDIDRIGRRKDVILDIFYNSGVSFEVVNIREPTKKVIETQAEFAEEECLRNRERTLRGLSYAKKQGKKLGNNTNLDRARKIGVSQSIARTNEFSNKIKNIIIQALKIKKLITHKEIAEYLNSQNIRTYQGKKWHTTTVRRIMKISVKKFLEEWVNKR